MARWHDVVTAVPEFASLVLARFTAAKHCTMATLRADGAPRISGTEVVFADGELWLNSMAGALKARDLRRDPRVALHCPTEDAPEEDPSSWVGDAKIAGRAHETSNPARLDQPHRFRVDITEVVLIRVGQPADHLVIDSWHPERGARQVRRY